MSESPPAGPRSRRPALGNPAGYPPVLGARGAAIGVCRRVLRTGVGLSIYAPPEPTLRGGAGNVPSSAVRSAGSLRPSPGSDSGAGIPSWNPQSDPRLDVQA